MKALLLILFSAYTIQGFAQYGLESMDNWYLHNLIIDDNNNPPPLNDEVNQVTASFFEEDVFYFQTYVCDGITANIDIAFGEEEFSLSEITPPTGPGCSFQQNQNFETLYFDFYLVNDENPFSYTIVEDGNQSLILTVTNIYGDTAIYGGSSLGNESFLMAGFIIYPNPVTNILSVTPKNITEKKFIIYSASGAKVLEQNTLENSIDVASLQNGIYFLKIVSTEGQSVQKFVKI